MTRFEVTHVYRHWSRKSKHLSFVKKQMYR